MVEFTKTAPVWFYCLFVSVLLISKGRRKNKEDNEDQKDYVGRGGGETDVW